MSDNPEIDELGLTKWDRRLLDPIVDFHSAFVLPKPDGWSRTKTVARYTVTRSGLVGSEDMSEKLIPKNQAASLTVVGRDEKLVVFRKHREATLITYRMLRLLEVDWLWCVADEHVTLRHRQIRKESVRVTYCPKDDAFEFLGKGKLFFSLFSNNRLIVREVTDERSKQYFERRLNSLLDRQAMA